MLIDEATNLPELHEVFAAALAPFGFEAFAGGTVQCGDQPATMFLQAWPAGWVNEYIANGYAADDPIIPEAIKSSKPFSPDDLNVGPDDRGWRVLVAAKNFGWKSILTFPQHRSNNHRGLICVASKQKLRDMPDLVDTISHHCRHAYSKGLILSGMATLKLTARECKALSLVAKGLSDADIAAHISISHHTAHRHVENARQKLGARSRSHAVAIALSHGLLTR